MKKHKTYRNVVYSADVLHEADELFQKLLSKEDKPKLTSIFSITIGDEEWNYDNPEEFFAEYRRGASAAILHREFPGYQFRVHVMDRSIFIAEMKAPTRDQIQALFEPFEANLSKATLPSVPDPIEAPTIFIGHGRSPLWRDLKDHLHEKHGYDVEAYEIGARAGHAVRDILEDMLRRSSFALLVLTAEDEDKKGLWHARDNVIHELGLFQGKLGFARAIILLEEGTEEFTNIAGIHQIRFSTGKIKETFGDVLATLRREFEKPAD